MADWFGPRRVLAVLSLLWAAATILTGLSWSVALARGVPHPRRCRGRRCVSDGNARAFTCWLPVRERGFAQGITHSFARLGGAVTPPIVLAIVARYGWREAFYVLGAASLAWTAVWVASFRDTPEEHPWVTASSWRRSAPAANRRGPRADRRHRRQIVRRMWARHPRRLLLRVVVVGVPDVAAVVPVGCPRVRARPDCADDDAAAARRRGGRHARGRHLGRDLPAHRQPPAGAARAAGRRPRRLGGAFLRSCLPAIVTGSALGAVYLLAAAFFFLELTNAVLWTLPLDIAGPVPRAPPAGS